MWKTVVVQLRELKKGQNVWFHPSWAVSEAIFKAMQEILSYLKGYLIPFPLNIIIE